MEFKLPADSNSGTTADSPLLSGGLRHEIALLLVHCYVLLITFGVFQRPFGNPFGFGFSSIVSVAIVALLFREAICAIRTHRMLQMWLLLLAYVCLITRITRPDMPLTDPEYLRIPGLLSSILLCAAIATLPWHAANLKRVGYVMVAGFAIVGVLAVLDDAGIVDLPPMNVSLINDPPMREPVAQFGHRSIMGLYLGMMLPFLFVLEDRDRNWRLRAAVLAVGVCFLYFLIYSRNRSGFGAIAIALATYYTFNLRDENRWLHPRVPGFALAVVLAFTLVYWFRHWQGATFVMLWMNSPIVPDIHVAGTSIKDMVDLKLNATQNSNLNNSDLLRVGIVKETILGLRENLIGRGFMTNTHTHFVIDIIYAAGGVGVLWLAAYAYDLVIMVRQMLRTGLERTGFWLLVTPLIAWFFVGAMFNAINMGLGWIFFGMLLAVHEASRIVTAKPAAAS